MYGDVCVCTCGCFHDLIVIQQIREEIAANFPGNAVPDFDSLKKLPYLKAALDETLRLYPAVPLDPKQPLKDDVLPNGAKVKTDDFVSWSAWVCVTLPILHA